MKIENKDKSAMVPPATGGTFNALTPVDHRTVSGVYIVLDADDVITSADPGYDPRLQPRDRRRDASEVQISTMTNDLLPELLGASVTTDMGSPLVNEYNQALSGNGRATVIREHYGRVNRNGEALVHYKQWLMSNIANFGFEPAQIQRISLLSKPVLLRRVDDYGGLTPAAFAHQSNRHQALGLSHAEQASVDASMLIEHPGLLRAFAPNEHGDVLAKSNDEFIKGFIRLSGDYATLMNARGFNRFEVSQRLKCALLAIVLGPQETDLITALLEKSEKAGINTVVKGLLSSASQLLQVQGTKFDLSGPLRQALSDLIDLRENDIRTDQFLDQRPLFDVERTEASDLLLSFLTAARSVKAINEMFARYTASARYAQVEVEHGNLFAGQQVGRPVKQLELLKLATRINCSAETLEVTT